MNLSLLASKTCISLHRWFFALWKLVEFTEVMTLMFSMYWLRHKDDAFAITLEIQIITVITLTWCLLDYYTTNINIVICLVHSIRDCAVLIVSDLLPCLLSYRNEQLIFPTVKMIKDFDQSLLHKRGIANFSLFLKKYSQKVPLNSQLSPTDFQQAKKLLSFLLISSEISLPNSLSKARKLIQWNLSRCLFPENIKVPAESGLNVAVSRYDLIQAIYPLRVHSRNQLKFIFDTYYLGSQLEVNFEIEAEQFHRWREWVLANSLS